MKVTIKFENVKNTFKKLIEDANKESYKRNEPVARSLMEELVLRTPIDTGLARASWSMIPVKNGYDIVNNVDYIEYLNQGSSAQAPAFFVEKTALKYGTPQGAIVEVS
jgi:hypothetical protein